MNFFLVDSPEQISWGNSRLAFVNSWLDRFFSMIAELLWIKRVLRLAVKVPAILKQLFDFVLFDSGVSSSFISYCSLCTRSIQIHYQFCGLENCHINHKKKISYSLMHTFPYTKYDTSRWRGGHFARLLTKEVKGSFNSRFCTEKCRFTRLIGNQYYRGEVLEVSFSKLLWAVRLD